MGPERWAKRSSEGRRWFLGRNDIGDYMHRWILQTPWFAIRVHHILRSDEARALHDHPWSFTSFLISGGYTEVTEQIEKFVYSTGEVWRNVQHQRYFPRWSVIHRRAGDAHRLVLDKPVWTLVVTGPQIRKWGFWIPGKGWTYWRDAMAYWAGDIGGRP